jgi:hypothetical protein
MAAWCAPFGNGSNADRRAPGLALANPGSGSVTFTLPSGTFTDLYGAVQGPTVTLAPGAGVVLLASSPQC